MRIDLAMKRETLTLVGSAARSPYLIELQDAASTRVVLGADYGAEAISPAIETIYDSDTSLLADGKTGA